MLHPYDKIRIGDQRQIFKRFIQVARTYLAGSARPVDRFGQTHPCFFNHRRSPYVPSPEGDAHSDLFPISKIDINCEVKFKDKKIPE
jgi:hypothetical protein